MVLLTLPFFRTCCMLLVSSSVAFCFNPDGKIKSKVPETPVFVTDDKFRNYRIEDFFWTGSGDGPDIQPTFDNETDVQNNVVHNDDGWRTTTVFHTTTILFATVFPSANGCGSHGCTSQVSPVWTDTIDFSSPVPSSPSSSVPSILPTPVQTVPPRTRQTPKFPQIPVDSITTPIPDITEISTVPIPVPPDQRYWILTVLRTEEGSEFRTNVIEERLSRLYQRAFLRKRSEVTGNVRVIIHNATRESSVDPNEVSLVYLVLLGGQPVPALSAAADMRLLTLSEVSAELGYPVLTKAEPYLKSVAGARVKGRSRDTWLLIGSVVAAVSLLVILAALFTLSLSRHRVRRSAARGAANRRQVYDGEEGTSNLAYDGKSESRDAAKAGKQDAPATVTFADDQRRGSTSSSSCSGSSEASLVRLRLLQKKKEMRKEDLKPKPRPRTRIRRVDNVDFKTDGNINLAGMQGTSSARSRDTISGITTDGIDDLDSIAGRNTSTPTSYLSMPSVKAFPRKARIPEPLNRVLEPISIRYLDADGDEDGVYPHRTRSTQQEEPLEARNTFVKGVTRHGSLEGDDPGVIGPVVWDRHCQELRAIQRDEMADTSGENISRVRKRFNELLDDAFSMFGSRCGSPDQMHEHTRIADSRIKSAVVNSKGDFLVDPIASRPKTTDSKRPQTAAARTPRGAWVTPNSRTPGRPLSAGQCLRLETNIPAVDPQLILVDSELSPSDPAVPLIAAIKDELKRFQKSDDV